MMVLMLVKQLSVQMVISLSWTIGRVQLTCLYVPVVRIVVEIDC